MIADSLRLAKFFCALAVKEKFLPRLHVRPLVAELFLTDNCNLKCISCACWRTRTLKELDTDEWKAVIDQIAELGIVKANFTGGEPLLRSDAPELIRYARDSGIHSLHLNSNAILLDQRRRTRVLDAGIRSFNISVDGADSETHEAIRGVPGSFDKTIRNLQELIALRKEYDIAIRMNFTVMRSNIANLPAIAELAQSLDVKLYLNLATDHTFLFRDQQVTGEAQIDQPEVDAALKALEVLLRRRRDGLPRYAELAYLRRHFTSLVQTDLPCAESQLKLMIHSTGGVGGCWGHDPHHNVRTTSLREIVDGEDYKDEHTRLFRKDCVGCGSNYALNLRWRGSSYMDDLCWRFGLKRLGR
ncbi:MAG TPA: radical SAM protein [Sphingobium sp.]